MMKKTLKAFVVIALLLKVKCRRVVEATTYDTFYNYHKIYLWTFLSWSAREHESKVLRLKE